MLRWRVTMKPQNAILLQWEEEAGTNCLNDNE
jgi:hypothetical protein